MVAHTSQEWDPPAGHDAFGRTEGTTSKTDFLL